MKVGRTIELMELRMFRAVDHPEEARKMNRASRLVFNALGLNNITSAEASWLKDPNTYLLVYYMKDTPVAGARLQLHNKDLSFPLVSAMRSGGLTDDVWREQLDSERIAEACGLWINDTYKGLGLMQSMCLTLLCLGQKLGLDKVLAICPRHTLDSLRRMGYTLVSSKGSIVRFFYPNPSYVSYFIRCDVRTFEFAARTELNAIQDLLRKDKNHFIISGRAGDLYVKMNGWPADVFEPSEDAQRRLKSMEKRTESIDLNALMNSYREPKKKGEKTSTSSIKKEII